MVGGDGEWSRGSNDGAAVSDRDDVGSFASFVMMAWVIFDGSRMFEKRGYSRERESREAD